MDRVYEGRRLATLNRETRTLQTQSTHCSPVSTLAIEQIASERKPFHDLVLSYRPDGSSPAHSNLLLVQSSWTIASQGHVRRRNSIGLTGMRSLYQKIQNHLLGPWVRELQYRPNCSLRGPNDIYSDSERRDQIRFLCGSLRRCPNLTHLHLEDSYPNIWTTTDSETNEVFRYIQTPVVSLLQ